MLLRLPLALACLALTGPTPDLEPLAASLAAAPASSAAPISPPAELDADAARRLGETEALLAAGQPTEALEKAELALEYAPTEPRLLDAASRAAEALGNRDLALWYLRRTLTALASAADGDVDVAWQKTLETRRGSLDPRSLEVDAALASYAEAIYELGNSAKRRDLWANAVEFLKRCLGTALHKKAEKLLDSIYNDDKATEALLASGLTIEFADPKRKKSREWIEREDKKREAWDKRYVLDTPGGYTIESNAGYEFTQELGLAIDQVNLFLREMYQHKVQGQRMRGCKILVHRTKDEFMAVWEQEPNIGGFFSPADNQIVTYDYRSVGQTTQDTMETIFHEVSHQFLRDVTKNTVPAWINEGIACFFEGTKRLPNGKVIANLIPEGRLTSLVSMLERDMVDLTDPLTYFQPGSYSGQFYPYGWGLVYFIRNYENERGERIYRPLFDEYVETFKSGGKRDLMAEWVETFVTRPGVAGVTTFEEFYPFWKQWIFDLNARHFGGPEVADDMIERGKLQVQNGFLENALDSFAWALRKRADDVVAMWELAETNRKLGRDDVAMFYYRRVLEWAESYVPDGDDGAATRAEWRIPGIGLTPEELAEKAFEQMAEVNDDVARGLRAADTQLRIALTALAQAYVADELPRTGLALLAQTEELVGTSAATTELFESIRADADIDLRQRRRLRVDPELSFWYANNDQWKAAGDDVVGKATGLTYLPYTELPPAEFLLEATVHIDALLGDGNQLFGLFLGSGFGERQVIAWESGLQQLVRLGVGLEGIALEGPIAPLRLKEGDTVNLGLDVSPEQVKFLIDGVEVGTFVYEPAQTRGQVGLMVQSAQVRFSNLRLTY